MKDNVKVVGLFYSCKYLWFNYLRQLTLNVSERLTQLGAVSILEVLDTQWFMAWPMGCFSDGVGLLFDCGSAVVAPGDW